MRRTLWLRGRKLPQPHTASNPMANQVRSGGISIVGGNGKIDINNTLDERLKLLESDALPMVRTSLFGKNDNRRFYD